MLSTYHLSDNSLELVKGFLIHKQKETDFCKNVYPMRILEGSFFIARDKQRREDQ